MVCKHIIVIIFLFLGFSCTDEPPLEDNPLDPGGGDYEIPSVSIISDFTFGEIVTTETITILLEGNELAVEYRVRMDDGEWVDWTTDKAYTFEYLDEGSHIIYAQSRYITEEESETVAIDFIVDAVSGPAMMFFPRRKIAEVGDQVVFHINAEEVSNLSGSEFVLEYNPDQISIEDVLSGNIFTPLGETIFFYDNNPEIGRLVITAAVFGVGEPSFTGTADIAEIILQVKYSGEIDIVFDGSELFRNSENESIQINTSIPGKIESN